MSSEISVLKQRLADPKLDKDRMREYLLRLVYVEMLGHSAAFGHIHAVKMTCETNLLNKKVGYLATSLFLDDQAELIILIVNTLQQDLKSDNCLVGAPPGPAPPSPPQKKKCKSHRHAAPTPRPAPPAQCPPR